MDNNKQELCESVTRTAPHPDAPTIESLVAKYLSKANDAIKARSLAEEAEEEAYGAWLGLIYAGKKLGLSMTPSGAMPAPELNITDWRKLRPGDVVAVSREVCGRETIATGIVFSIVDKSTFPIIVGFSDGVRTPFQEFKFIRRPPNIKVIA